MINPVLRREWRTRLRTWKAPILLIVYLLFLGGVGGLILFANEYDSFRSGFNPQSYLEIYMALACFQLGLIVMITPALTAGSISGERERQTLDILLTTKMSPFSIITGKLLASLSQIVLLILASMPIFSVIFIYGGISVLNVCSLFFYFVITAMMVGSAGVFCSTFFKKTTVSTVITYLFIFTLCLGTIVFLAIFEGLSYRLQGGPMSYKQGLMIAGWNPFIGFLSVIQGQMGFDILEDMLNMRHAAGKIMIQPWQVNVLFDIILTVLFVFFSTLKIRPVRGSVLRSSKR